MSEHRIFCGLGVVVYMLVFYFLEKKTGIPFVTDKVFCYVIAIIWVIICIVVGIVKSKSGDDEFFKS